MAMVRRRVLAVIVVFVAGILFGFFGANPWLVLWYKNRLLILADPVSKNLMVSRLSDRYRNNTEPLKIVCMVLSQLEGLKAQSVMATWGRRCTYIFFVTSHTSDNLPTVVAPLISESRSALWTKVVYGLSHAYSTYYNKADWFLKADDDTYVVVDNLKLLLAGYNSSTPMYFGCRFEKGHMSGGAGYVMSKAALRLFAESSHYECRKPVSESEDVNLGKCFQSLNIPPIDTRDIFGRERFLVVLPFKDGIFVPGHTLHDFWYWTNMYHPARDWYDCCAESAITFHYVQPSDMMIIDFFLYHLSPSRR